MENLDPMSPVPPPRKAVVNIQQQLAQAKLASLDETKTVKKTSISISKGLFFSLITLVLVMSVVISVLAVNLKKANDSAVANVKKNAVVKDTPAPATPEQKKTVILQRAKLTFPNPAGASDVDQTSLPASLSQYILPNSQQLKIKKVVYEDKTEGYMVSYKIQKKLTEITPDFVKISGSYMTNAQWTDMFGLIEVAHENFVAQITFTFFPSSQTSVLIQTQNKK